MRLVEEDDHQRGRQEARNTETAGGGHRGRPHLLGRNGNEAQAVVIIRAGG